MHDWTILSVQFEWMESTIIIKLLNRNSQEVELLVRDSKLLHIPKQEDWGESSSVNEIIGPTLLENGNHFLAIEIQSGDKIELEGGDIIMPDFDSISHVSAVSGGS